MKLSSGGAGVGDPRERDRGKVLEDVRNEIVSLEAARGIYGLTDAELRDGGFAARIAKDPR